VKFIFNAFKFVLKKIFNPSNVTEPLKYLMKLLFGFDIGKVAERNTNKSINYSLLEKSWESASN